MKTYQWIDGAGVKHEAKQHANPYYQDPIQARDNEILRLAERVGLLEGGVVRCVELESAHFVQIAALEEENRRLREKWETDSAAFDR